MQKSFTQNHLVTLLMGDLTPTERSAHLETVNTDWTLREAYKDLKKATTNLPKIVLRPGRQAVNNILRYSKKSVVEA